MTLEQILEIIEHYKLRIPPTVFYDLKADIVNFEEPTTKNDLGVETTQMIDKSNFSQEQYKADLQSAYDCGYAQAKNDLGVDCISRQALYDALYERFHEEDTNNITNVTLGSVRNFVKDFPSVTPQEPQTFKWCTGCREYNQEKHCCPRWSKVIRDTVEEMKKEYIEREVLDKIRAELQATAELHDDGDYYLREGWIGEIFDKYKAENNS